MKTHGGKRANSGRKPQQTGQPRIATMAVKLSEAEFDAVVEAGGSVWARGVILRAMKRKAKQ